MIDIKDIATEIAEKVNKKDNDYDSAFAKGVDEYGWYEYLVQLGHKYNRVKALTIKGKDHMVINESVEDSVVDIIGYSLQMLKYIREHDENEMLIMERDVY